MNLQPVSPFPVSIRRAEAILPAENPQQIPDSPQQYPFNVLEICQLIQQKHPASALFANGCDFVSHEEVIDEWRWEAAPDATSKVFDAIRGQFAWIKQFLCHNWGRLLIWNTK
ncbi:MAG: hypothetical protein WCF19_05580, partial [Chlamydiales bacterium]